jgi:hypothetical protein
MTMETDRSVSMVTFVKDSFHSVKGIVAFFLRSRTPSIPQTALHKVYLTSQPGPQGQVSPAHGGIAGTDYELFWSTEVL